MDKTLLDKKLEQYAEKRFKELRAGLMKFSQDLVVRYPELKRHGGCGNINEALNKLLTQEKKQEILDLYKSQELDRILQSIDGLRYLLEAGDQ